MARHSWCTYVPVQPPNYHRMILPFLLYTVISHFTKIWLHKTKHSSISRHSSSKGQVKQKIVISSKNMERLEQSLKLKRGVGGVLGLQLPQMLRATPTHAWHTSTLIAILLAQQYHSNGPVIPSSHVVQGMSNKFSACALQLHASTSFLRQPHQTKFPGSGPGTSYIEHGMPEK